MSLRHSHLTESDIDAAAVTTSDSSATMAGSHRKSTLLYLSFTILLIGPWLTKGDQVPLLPPGVEIVSPKELGLSQEEVDKFLGKVSAMNANAGNGPKTQILTVGFDANKKLNLENFQSLPAGMSAADKMVSEMTAKGLEKSSQLQFGAKTKTANQSPPRGNVLVVPTRAPLAKTGQKALNDINAELHRQIMETMQVHQEQITELETKPQKQVIPIKKPPPPPFKLPEHERHRGQGPEQSKNSEQGHRGQAAEQPKNLDQERHRGQASEVANKSLPPPPAANRTAEKGKDQRPRSANSSAAAEVQSTAANGPLLPTAPSKGKFPQVAVLTSPQPLPAQIVVRSQGKLPEQLVVSTPQQQPITINSAQQQQILGDVQQQGPISFAGNGEGLNATAGQSGAAYPNPQSHQQVQFVQGPVYVQHQQHPYQQHMVLQQHHQQHMVLQQHPQQIMYHQPQFAYQQPPQQFPQGSEQYPGQLPPQQQHAYSMPPQDQFQGQVPQMQGHPQQFQGQTAQIQGHPQQFQGQIPPAVQDQPQQFQGHAQQFQGLTAPIQGHPQQFQAQIPPVPQEQLQQYQGQIPQFQQQYQGSPVTQEYPGQTPHSQEYQGQVPQSQPYQVHSPQYPGQLPAPTPFPAHPQAQQYQSYAQHQSAPVEYPGQQPIPAEYAGQQHAPVQYPGQQPAPVQYPGQQPAPAQYPGQQPVPAEYPGYAQSYPGQYPSQAPPQSHNEVQYVQVHHHQHGNAPEQHYYPAHPSPETPSQSTPLQHQYFRPQQHFAYPSPPPTQAEVIYGQPQPSPPYSTRETYSLPTHTVTYPGNGQVDHRGSTVHSQALGLGPVDVVHKGNSFQLPLGDQRENSINYREVMKYLHHGGQTSLNEIQDSHRRPAFPLHGEEPRAVPTPFFFESDHFRALAQQKEREYDSVAVRSQFSFATAKPPRAEFNFYKSASEGFKFPEGESQLPDFNSLIARPTPESPRASSFFSSQGSQDPSVSMLKISSPENAVRSAGIKTDLRPTLQTLFDQMRSESRSPAQVQVPSAKGTHYNKNLDPLFSHTNIKSMEQILKNGP